MLTLASQHNNVFTISFKHCHSCTRAECMHACIHAYCTYTLFRANCCDECCVVPAACQCHGGRWGALHDPEWFCAEVFGPAHPAAPQPRHGAADSRSSWHHQGWVSPAAYCGWAWVLRSGKKYNIAHLKKQGVLLQQIGICQVPERETIREHARAAWIHWISCQNIQLCSFNWSCKWFHTVLLQNLSVNLPKRGIIAAWRWKIRGKFSYPCLQP